MVTVVLAGPMIKVVLVNTLPLSVAVLVPAKTVVVIVRGLVVYTLVVLVKVSVTAICMLSIIQ